MQAPPALVIFARAPVPGMTKTRLIPTLGPEGAAQLYRCFLLDVLTRAASAEETLLVAASEAAEVPALEAMIAEVCPGAALFVQTGSDLGERMLNALRRAFGCGYGRTVILGSDVPSLPWDHVTQALHASRDLVLGPCLDGGYSLIGLREIYPRLFMGMRWSTTSVCSHTLARARGLGLSVSLLDPWYDVDTPDDLGTLFRHLTMLSLAGEEVPCPHTFRYLGEMQDGDWHVRAEL